MSKEGRGITWTRRQIALAAVLLALFVAAAAVIPVLISPSHPQAAPEVTPTPSGGLTPSSIAVVGTPVATATSTPKPTPTPTRDPFLVQPAVRPRPVGDPPDRVYREFQSACGLVRVTSKPPLDGAKPKGSFAVFGSEATSRSTPPRVPGGSTSCQAAGDRSSYWVPVLRQGTLEDFTVFYKAGVDDYTTTQPFPTGLRIVANSAAETPDWARANWSCTGSAGPTIPTSCPAGDRLILRMSLPSCWDGRHLDSAGHHGHLTYPFQGRCPSSYPVVLPQLQYRLTYVLGSGRPALATGDGSTYGLGFVAGWQPAALAKLVKDCVNGGRQCDANGRDL